MIKRLIIFVIFLGIMFGAYYFYEQKELGYKEERDKLAQKEDQKNEDKLNGYKSVIEDAEKVQKEAETKRDDLQKVISQAEKDVLGSDKVIRDQRQELQKLLKENSEEKKNEIRAKMDKIKEEVVRLKARLGRVQQAEIDKHAKVVAEYDAQIKALDAKIDQVDNGRKQREAAILAKSNVADPEKYMVQRDANRQAAESAIAKVKAQIEKIKAQRDIEYSAINAVQDGFYDRPIVIANLEAIDKQEKEQRQLADQLGRLTAGRITDDDPEIAALIAKQKEMKKNLTDLKNTYKQMNGDVSKAKTGVTAATQELARFKRACEDSKSDVLKEVNDKMDQFKKFSYGMAFVIFLVFSFLFFKAGDASVKE